MDRIYGGSFQVARQIFSSEIWREKPSSWKVIWIYILGKVNHKKNGKFNRGEGFFNFSEEKRQIGNDITTNMIKRFCQYAIRSYMISTRRSTRGMIIKVINYDKYQTLANFTSTDKSTSKAREKHEPSTPINKNVKNDKNVRSISTQGVEGINSLISLFKEVNPSYERLYKIPAQRKALERLVGKFGEEDLRVKIGALSKVNKIKYMPITTTPYELEINMPKILFRIEQERSGNKKKIEII